MTSASSKEAQTVFAAADALPVVHCYREADQVIRLDGFTVDYFKSLADELDLPYQTLINLYLRECAGSGRRLAMEWRPRKHSAA